MIFSKSLILLVFTFILFIIIVKSNESNQKKIVCYYSSWSIYRNGNGHVEINDLDPFLCTHIIYSFVGLNLDGHVNDLDPQNGALNGLLHTLKEYNPNIKLMAAIGGWNEGSKKYSIVMNSNVLRKELVNSVTNFVQDKNLDGFDIDWEYPGERGGSPSTDRNVFVEFLKELRASFDRINNELLITAAVGALNSLTRTAYDIPNISKYFNFINLMTYDYHGSWDTKTGQSAPLYSNSDSTLSVDNTIQHWINLGAPPEKLILGIGVYGRTFTLKSPNQNQLGAPVYGPGIPGQYSKESGIMTYLEICETFKNDNNWIKKWDDQQKNPFAYNYDQWIGYDNIESVKLKVQYSIDHNLGGVMVWTIDSDDVKNICGDGSYPILKAINQIIMNNNTNVPEKIKCKEDEMFAPDPDNCQYFYSCNGGEPTIRKKCPYNLYFDKDLLFCASQKFAKCLNSY